MTAVMTAMVTSAVEMVVRMVETITAIVEMVTAQLELTASAAGVDCQRSGDGFHLLCHTHRRERGGRCPCGGRCVIGPRRWLRCIRSRKT